MKIKLKRNTGFFAMGTPFDILMNKRSFTKLSHNDSKEIDYQAGDVLRAKYSLLKSNEVTLSEEDEGATFEISSNPNIMRTYITIFTLLFIFPILFQQWLLAIFIIVFYLIFGIVMSNRFYLIKKIDEVPLDE
ncbi:hypothetical protein [Vagococcus xieshaowenii]|uniref:Uncharacterized protein n=1 Tax=Vagococcus xieshaowenii TaxID=2562451 RepID=A0A4Z0D6Y0_9ENTE|nr:hypothetical protein [Vagococcus xieshaowenii]QCA28584.1 hypothetical protein E4Z98_04365 [Vagococcus xieshaowenii]TFZ40608.1 hypothetical protein E4031_07410 [Vagococcus xieshaowenii]